MQKSKLLNKKNIFYFFFLKSKLLKLPEFQIPLQENAQKNTDNNRAYKAFLNHSYGKDFMLFEQLYANPNSNPIMLLYNQTAN